MLWAFSIPQCSLKGQALYTLSLKKQKNLMRQMTFNSYTIAFFFPFFFVLAPYVFVKFFCFFLTVMFCIQKKSTNLMWISRFHSCTSAFSLLLNSWQLKIKHKTILNSYNLVAAAACKVSGGYCHPFK